MSSDPIIRVNRRSVVDEVRAQLVSLIESGHFRVDERLPSENELARSFNVSRPMVREAPVGLQALGLTTSRNGSGTFVISNQVKTASLPGRYPSGDLTEVRLLVEVPAAGMAAQRRSSDHVRRLGELQTALLAEEDEAGRQRIDGLFHLCIAAATGNPILACVVADFRTLLDEQARTKSILPARRSAEIEEHQAIYAAIVGGDAQAARQAMEHHLRTFDRVRDAAG